MSSTVLVIVLLCLFYSDAYFNILPMSVDELSVFETVHEVTDFIQINLKNISFVSLSFLRNLKVIRGLKTTVPQ